MQRLMTDSRLNEAEWHLQPMFSKSLFFSSLALATPVFALATWTKAQPTRVALPDRSVEGRAEAVAPTGRDIARPDVRLWRLFASDPRFGGLSGLAVDGGELIAVTDSGATIRFAPPVQSSQRIIVRLHDLPDGPGDARRKRGRDSEALLADPGGRGWWVAFEGRHSLWRYDSSFARASEVRWLTQDWPAITGAEALIADDRGGIQAMPEGGDELAPAGTSDATRLGDGRAVLLVRHFGWRGFVNEVRIAGRLGEPPVRMRLPLGPFDNAESIAAAPLPNGGTRLWILTDNNFRPWMRTLLVALDLPSA